MCGGRKVTRSITGHGKYCCACAHLTGKYKFRLHMRTLKGKMKLSVAHAHFQKNLHSAPFRSRLKLYIPCTFTKSIVYSTYGRAFPSRVKLATQAVVSSSAPLGFALDSTMARAANFTHSSKLPSSRTRKKFILKELPNNSETEDMRKTR